VEWREGQGLFATNVQWTANAAAAIAALEYRYLSPVLEYEPKTGEVLRVLMVAVTNFPAIDGLGDLTARAAARFSPDDSTHEEQPVNREQLLALLALPATATDADIETAMAALKAKADQVDALNTEVAALKTKQVDPAKFVPVTVVDELKTQIAALSGKILGGEVESVIAQAEADGKLLPAQVEWARELGNSNIAQLKSYIEKTPVIAALKGSQTGGKAPAGVTEGGELDSTALAVCKQLGLSADEYKKSVGVSA
jgi:phage I-like protein